MPDYRIPAVYIEEVSTFPPSFVPINSAIPVFTGFTEKAERAGQSLAFQPILIHSLLEYRTIFGTAHQPKFIIADNSSSGENEFLLYGQKKYLQATARFYMYESVQMYLDNGGGPLYILSLGNFGDRVEGLSSYESLDTTKNVFSILALITDASLLVFPDAVSMSVVDCCRLYGKAMEFCNDVSRAFLICDVLNTQKDLQKDVADFRNNIVPGNLQHAAAYYPWLLTASYAVTSIGLTDFQHPLSLTHYVKEPAALDVLNEFQTAGENLSAIRIQEIHDKLLVISPGYTDIISAIVNAKNLQPPSGAVCGAYVRTDRNTGVWKAPANVQLVNVARLNLRITDAEQSGMNAPVDGKAINAIREFAGRGILIWGARTLDGNSNDWRYISVVRMVKMIKDSIHSGLQAYAFEPNNDNSWAKIKGSVENFLTQLWRNGALTGIKPEEAYFVAIGLGRTMTAIDILENKMIMQVGISITRPAEFITISFEVKVQQV